MRLLLVLTAVALPLVWWRRGGWRAAAMLLVGATISATGLWEWLRLLTAVMARMDGESSTGSPAIAAAEEGQTATTAELGIGLEDGEVPKETASKQPEKVGGMGMLLSGFFVRLGLVVLVLYGSLRYLEGSVVALAVGLGLGVFSLTVEGLRLVKAWTV